MTEEATEGFLVNDGIQGIILAGASSSIKGLGTVKKCNVGVVLGGGGKHTVARVTAKESVETANVSGIGFFTNSSRNLLLANKSTQNEVDGYQSEGNLNKFSL